MEGSENKIFPINRFGVEVISMGFFLPQGEAVVWRGPMLDKVVTQFIGDVVWGDLDYLIADLPPGTGDVQLSLCQKMSITGAVVVSTPQDVALNIAQKAIAMFNKLNCKVLGVIENMSWHKCEKCGNIQHIFGHGGAKKMSENFNVPFLGEIPLSLKLCQSSDKGVPIVIDDPESSESKSIMEIVGKLASTISVFNKSI